MLIERVQEGKNNQQQIRILSRTTWELSTHTSPWDQMHCIQGSGDNWLMPFTRLLSIIFERLWRSDRSPDDWGNANIAHIFKKGQKENPENYKLVSLTLVPWKMMEEVLLEKIPGHRKEKNSQHGLTKGKSCLNHLIAFLKEKKSLTLWTRGEQ